MNPSSGASATGHPLPASGEREEDRPEADGQAQASWGSFPLSGLCAKLIVDSYWYGLYSEFLLIVDTRTDRFNATHLCRQHGKQLKEWLAETEEVFEYYSGDAARILVVEPRNVSKYEKYNTLIPGMYLKGEHLERLCRWISIEHTIMSTTEHTIMSILADVLFFRMIRYLEDVSTTPPEASADTPNTEATLTRAARLSSDDTLGKRRWVRRDRQAAAVNKSPADDHRRESIQEEIWSGRKVSWAEAMELLAKDAKEERKKTVAE